MRPRIRTIKPDLWQDERVGRLSPEARLLYVGLITMADDEGRFRALTSAIAGHCFIYDEERATRQLRKWVAEVQASGMVLFYKHEGVPYGAFRHWKKHQKINRPVPSDLPPPPDHSIVTDNSVKDPDSLSDLSVNVPGAVTTSRAGARSIPFLSVEEEQKTIRVLCDRLADKILANDPKAKVDPRSERWLTSMRLLVADRGGDDAAVVEVRRIIDWCQGDDFWRPNILSPSKLREQFTKLLLSAARRGGNVVAMAERDERAARGMAAIDELMNRRGA